MEDAAGLENPVNGSSNGMAAWSESLWVVCDGIVHENESATSPHLATISSAMKPRWARARAAFGS